jgi:gliding motility-associated-like protein
MSWLFLRLFADPDKALRTPAGAMKSLYLKYLRQFVGTLLCSLGISFAWCQHVLPDMARTASADTSHISICSNQLPYLWNGISCLTAGSYTATLQDENGNNFQQVLQLQVNNVGSSITNASVCDNQLPYSWNGHSYNNSGTYSVTLNSANGCDSVPILSLTVNHVTGSTTYRSICSSALPFEWNGSSYNSSGVYSLTLTSSAGCDSVAKLNLNVRPVSASITTIEVCSNRLPFNWNGNSYHTAGTYQVQLTSANGCDSIATLQLNVKPVATSFTIMEICSNQLPFHWNDKTITAAGNYTSSLQSPVGCDSLATLIVTIKPIPSSTTTLRICNASLPYTWNSIECHSSGTYTAHLVSSTGCDSVANLNLSAQPVINTSVVQTVCINDLPYSWNGQSISAAGAYQAHFVSQAGCDSIVTLNLTVASPSSSPLALTICENQLPYSWHGHIFHEAGTYAIDPPVQDEACHSINAIQLTILPNLVSTTYKQVCPAQLPYHWNGESYSSAGTYSVLIHRNTGCDSTAILVLNVNNRLSSYDSIRICRSSLPFYWNGMFLGEAGDYAVNLVAHAGCDSVSNLHLTIDSSYIKDINISVCENQLPYSWNGQQLTASGNYLAGLHATTGCDSIIKLHFTAGPYVMIEESVSICHNQIPYAWRGTMLSHAGTYYDTIPGTLNCDSIIGLSLVINDEISSETNIRVCQNELPYLWNGNLFNEGGSFTHHFVSAGGCDSVAYLNLVVLQPAVSHTYLSLCNNQLPYTWNGHAYPSSGVYAVSLSSVDGCDSTAVLHLNVTNILTSTTNVTVCPAQLPYLWNGQTYNTAGTYSVTINNPDGCDSVPILSLTVAPQSVSNTAISICASELPYHWNGQDYSAPGIYTVSLTGAGGCDSLATLNLSVRELSSSFSALTICSGELPYVWNGLTISVAGNYTTVLNSSNGCDSTAHLELHVTHSSSSTETVQVCASSLPYHWNGHDFTGPGTYTVPLVNASGCDSITVLHLIVGNVSISSTEVNLCPADLPFNWQGMSIMHAGIYRDTLVSATGCDSILILNLAVNQPSVTNQSVAICSSELPYSWCGSQIHSGGEYAKHYVAANGCDSVVHLHLQVSGPSESSSDISICSGQLPYVWNGQSLNSSGDYTVTMNNAAGCDSIVRLHLSVKDTSSSFSQYIMCSSELPYVWNGMHLTSGGLYTALLNNFVGCDSLAQLELIVHQTPSPPEVVSPVTYCQGSPPSALIAHGENLLWFLSTDTIGYPVSPVPPTNIAGVQTWFVSQNIGGCNSIKVPLTVRVKETPALGADKSLAFCYEDFVNLDLIAQTNFSHNWSLESQPVLNPQHITAPGMYRLIAASTEGCSDTVNITLTRQARIIANAGLDATVETGFPYQLHGTGGLNYEWSPANLLDNYRIANPKATIGADTYFVLTVRDDAGCIAHDSVFLRVLDGPGFYVPTAFTPNGDGLNDQFRPLGVGIERLDYFRVFNRYGQLMFETNEVNRGWDGTYKGVKQAAGDYVWMLQALDRKGKLRVLRGNAVLIR